MYFIIFSFQLLACFHFIPANPMFSVTDHSVPVSSHPCFRAFPLTCSPFQSSLFLFLFLFISFFSLQDVSSPASVAAYIVALSSKLSDMRRGTFCSFDAFTKRDVRIELVRKLT